MGPPFKKVSDHCSKSDEIDKKNEVLGEYSKDKSIDVCSITDLNLPDEDDHLRRPLLFSPMVYPTPRRIGQSKTTAKLSIEGHASIFSTTINLFSTMMGAGMLGLPYAMANSGAILGLVGLFVIGFGEVYALHLLGKCVYKENKFSFRALAKKTFKFKGNELVVNFILAMATFGCCCSYLIICGQLVPDLVRDFLNDLILYPVLIEPGFWVTIIVWVIAFPLVCFKHLDSLKFTSTLGVLGLLYVTAISIIFAWGDGLAGDPCSNRYGCPGKFMWAFPGNVPNMLRVISVFCFSFLAAHNVPSLAFELKNRSVRRFDMSIFGAFILSALVFSSLALSGYRTYGDWVNADLLKSFPISIFTTIARLCLLVVLCAGFPLQMFQTKNAVCNIFFGLDAFECSKVKYYSSIIVILLIAWGIGVLIDDLSIMLAFFGATFSVFVGLSLPSYFYIKLFAKERFTFDKVVSYSIFIASIVLSPLLVAVEIFSLVPAQS